MNILVIGASGLVGYNCYNFFKDQVGVNVIGTHRYFSTSFTQKFDTVDLGDEEFDLLNKFSPDVIIHCGALTNVDECETNPDKSFAQTVNSTKNVIKIATQFNSKIVYISTDYVFNGESGPYKETDIVDPINIYGKHKLLAEKRVLEQNPNNLIIRVTNVYGDEIRGKNFVSRLLSNPTEQINLRLPIDQFATPISALDIAKAIFHLIVDNKQGIYHLGSTDYFNRFQLAQKILSIVPNPIINIEPLFTKDLKQSALRPLLGGLISFKFLSEYPNFKFSNIDIFINNKVTIAAKKEK